MSQDFENENHPKDEDWSEYAQQDDTEIPIRPLDYKDYLAIFIASLQTIFLPLILLLVIMLVIAFALQLFFISP